MSGDVTIHKIKLSGDTPTLEYTRALANGMSEVCKLAMYPPPIELELALHALLDDCIQIIGLDVDRWSDAKVTGLSIQRSDGKMGFVATLINREDLAAQVANTRAVKAEEVTSQLRELLVACCEEAIAYINSQPVQTEIEFPPEVSFSVSSKIREAIAS